MYDNTPKDYLFFIRIIFLLKNIITIPTSIIPIPIPIKLVVDTPVFGS